jgi:hypothetical protein
MLSFPLPPVIESLAPTLVMVSLPSLPATDVKCWSAEAPETLIVSAPVPARIEMLLNKVFVNGLPPQAEPAIETEVVAGLLLTVTVMACPVVSALSSIVSKRADMLQLAVKCLRFSNGSTIGGASLSFA